MELVQPFRVDVEWIRQPSWFDTETIALTHIWFELTCVIGNHSAGAEPQTVLSEMLNEVQVLRGIIGGRIVTSQGAWPRFATAWRGNAVDVTLAYIGSVSLPGQKFSGLYVILSSEFHEVGPEDYTKINLAFLRPGATEWFPFVTNTDGHMAVVVEHYRAPHLRTPLKPVIEPLYRLRGLPPPT